MGNQELWSVSSRGPVTLRADEDSLRLGWDLSNAGEPLVGLVFTRVHAYRYRAGPHTVSDLDAYERLVELEDDAWLDELRAGPMGSPSPIRHFMIYFVDAGVYEIAAESWALLPPLPGLDGRPLGTMV
jgi:hypothetical protein